MINTKLDTSGHLTEQPLPNVSVPTTSIDTNLIVSGPLLPTSPWPTTGTKANILAVPIATGSPPQHFVTRQDHPRPPVNISGRSGPLQTNKFYGNLLVGDQREPIWPQPYSLWWAKDGNSSPRMGLNNSWGLAISNIDRDRLRYGDSIQTGDSPKYFIAPLYVQEMILSATELGPDTLLTTDSHKQFSVNVNLQPSSTTAPVVRFPIVQGMGFVSGLYVGATPLIRSNVIFTEIVEAGTVNGGATYKWRVSLKDNSRWLVYMTPNGAAGRPPMLLQDSNNIIGPTGYSGLIQVAKTIVDACGELVHDGAAGTYPLSASVSASVEGSVGTYSFAWTRGGSKTQSLLMYALPHHLNTMSADTLKSGTCAVLWTSTKGLARGFTADVWTLQEEFLPVNIGFDPWRLDLGTVRKVAAPAVDLITEAASKELAVDLDILTNEPSAYFGGKASAHPRQSTKRLLIAYRSNSPNTPTREIQSCWA